MRNNHAGNSLGKKSPCKRPAIAPKSKKKCEAKAKAKAEAAPKAVKAHAKTMPRKTSSAMPASIQADFKQRSRIYIMSKMRLYPKRK